jgi:ABC-type amino acid transport system permease subunit
VGLSLIAFIGGGLVGLALLLARLAKLPGAQRGVAGYVQLTRMLATSGLSFTPRLGRPKKIKNSCTMNGVLRISST